MKVFGYSISINVLILLGILYLIMVVNALSASCNREGYGVQEGPMKNINNIISQIKIAKTQNSLTDQQKNDFTKALSPYKNAGDNSVGHAYFNGMILLR